jgi:chorismate lyase/3-hydroxybenzoate synthase
MPYRLPRPSLLDRAPDAPTLATIGHGTAQGDVSLRLAALQGPALEVWPAAGPLRSGQIDGLFWRSDGQHAFVWIEFPAEDIEDAAETAYTRILAALEVLGFPHLLRLWNFFPAINAGTGDAERYRLFVRGRARASAGAFDNGFPAATAIGTGDGGLVVYGLAARYAGLPMENPRQVPAWRYPRRYGPVPPGFARATLTADGSLLISGTASVVGHESAHPGDVVAQLREARTNLESLCARARSGGGAGALGLLKVYLRHRGDLPRIQPLLDPGVPTLVLEGDICRAELLVELEGVWLSGTPAQ